MSGYAELMQEKRNKSIADMRAILDRAVEDARELTPEEVEMVERADADSVRYAEEVKRELRAQELAKEAAEFRMAESRIELPAPQSQPDSELDMFKRGFEAVRNGGSYVIDYEKLRTHQPSETFYRALQSAGGSAIPTTFVENVIWFQRTMTPMLNPDIVTILETSDGRPIDLPRITADPSHGGTVTAEAGGINELDPTISKESLGAFKYAITNLWSAELDQDNVINLQQVLARSTARELSIDIGAHLTTGTGTVQPDGIVDDASNGGTANGTAQGTSLWTFFGPHDLLDIAYSVEAPYRTAPGAGYMMNRNAILKSRKFRDSNHQFLWQPSFAAGEPDTLNGYPVYENPAMADPASATKSVLFGDFKAYFVRRTPIRVEFSRDYKFNTDQLALRTVMRVDGALPDVIAVKYLVSANT